MFTVKLEVNGALIRRLDAVRQSGAAYGQNEYTLRIDGAIVPGFTIQHIYEEGALVLAKKIVDSVEGLEKDFARIAP